MLVIILKIIYWSNQNLHSTCNRASSNWNMQTVLYALSTTILQQLNNLRISRINEIKLVLKIRDHLDLDEIMNLNMTTQGCNQSLVWISLQNRSVLWILVNTSIMGSNMITKSNKVFFTWKPSLMSLFINSNSKFFLSTNFDIMTTDKTALSNKIHCHLKNKHTWP